MSKIVKFCILIILFILSLSLFAEYPVDCITCHTNKNIGKDPHGGIAKECLFCHKSHDPSADRHDPENPNNLIIKDINQLCFSCHEKFTSGFPTYGSPAGGHPIAKHPIEGGPDPLYPARKFTCASCHNPHGSTGKKLFRYKLKRNQMTCAICHKGIFGDTGDETPPWEEIPF